jgi:hypothetical protein
MDNKAEPRGALPGDFLCLLLDMRQGAEFEYLPTLGKKIFSTFFNLPIDKSPVI